MKQDYYEILGISKSASEAEIKRAYRKKAIQYHPDKNPGDKKAEEKFKLAAEAYEILSNAEKKAQYDQFGHAAFEGGNGGGGYRGGSMNMDDIFSQFGDIFGDAFGGFGGGSRRTVNIKGSDLRIQLKLSLEDIAKGVEKKIRLKRKVKAPGVKYKTCQNCNGSGQVLQVSNTILGRMQTATACGMCNGSGQILKNKPAGADNLGFITREQTVNIRIPAGVEEGMQLKMSGQGNEAPSNGISGDLIVAIEELEHKFLKREGSNLHYDLYISFPEAVLGTSKEIKTVTGKALIKLDAGIQSGKILRLRGKGIPIINSYGTGDMIIHVNVWTPKELNKEQKQFFEQMKGDENFAPNPNPNEKSFFDKVRDFFS